MERNDFSVPQRMSPGAFLIIFIKKGREIISLVVLLILYKFFDSDADVTAGAFWLNVLLTFGAGVGLSLLLACASYFSQKFYVSDGNLVFISGILTRSTTSIPLDKIHSLRTEQGIWYRILDLRGIIFDTLATKTEEVEIILSESHWRALMALIQQEETRQPEPAATPPDTPADSRTVLYDNGKLFLDALCQNHLKGMAILGAGITAIANTLNDMPGKMLDNAAEYLEAHLVAAATPEIMLVSFAFAYIVAMVLWVGKILLRYYDMSLTFSQSLLSFRYGLLTQSSCRFFHDKICTIWIKRNYFEKRWGLSTLMLKQAFNATDAKEENNLKLYGSDNSGFFLRWWLGEDFKNAPDILTSHSGRGVFFRSIWWPTEISVTAAAVMIYYGLHLWLWVPAAFFSVCIFRGICAMRHSKITLRSSYLIIHSGRFAEIESYLKYSDIEGVRIRRTPFSRWSRRVALTIATPGSDFTVRSLPKDEVLLLQEYLLHKTESGIKKISSLPPQYLELRELQKRDEIDFF